MTRALVLLLCIVMIGASLGVFLESCGKRSERAQPSPPPTIAAAEAKHFVGKTATVCGRVVHTHFARYERGAPTFLNFGGVFPNQDFTVVIWAQDRDRFSAPEVVYLDKYICVTGAIYRYRDFYSLRYLIRGVPHISVRDPRQIEIMGR
jgi:hypothetical protein